MEEEENQEQESGGQGFNPDALRSYLTFAKGALKARRGLSVAIGVGVLVLTVLAVRFIPKTYACSTSLIAVENAVLDQNGGSRPLAAAEGLLMRHENLEQLIVDTHLLESNAARRPPLLKLKDRISEALRGPLDRKTQISSLVGTLETRIKVEVKESELTITVEWTDPTTCAELAEATKNEFLKLRHTAEISAFQEKIEILDEHATQLRQEVEALAEQLKSALAARAEEVARTGTTAPHQNVPATPTAPRQTAKQAGTDEQVGELKKRLTDARAQLAAAEQVRNAKMATEQAKLDELKVRYTASHPQVIAQEQRLAIASDVPSELALLRSDVADIESQLRSHEGGAGASTKAGGATGANAEARQAATNALLPSDILRLLEREDVDPALGAQMSSAVLRYSSLMDGVRGSKLALDTAQAAFKHRYQVVIPVEEPTSPLKPKPGVIAGVGIFLALLLSLLVPILLELRRGVLVERWQVDMLQLRVLADLRLPAKKV